MIGKVVSHYKIIEKLGGGGMGVVYRAEDTMLKRFVALKFLPANLAHDLEAKTRFIHEAQAASALDHPNICNIHEISQTADGQLFICMTLYQGETLKKKIQQKSLTLDQILTIALQTAGGLACAHEAGIIHRDLKPANIMITAHDEVKIVDFGLAKLSGQTEITRKGSPLGTGAYMSTEQTRGEPLEARTDIWSFGVMLYELLSGEQPFKGDYEQAVIYSILNEDPLPIQDLRPDIPEELHYIVGRCLQKNPSDRFARLEEIIEILDQICQGVTPSGHVYKLKTAQKKPEYLKKYAWPLIGFAFLAIILIVWQWWFSLPQEKHLLIFPFKNLNGDLKGDTYCRGLVETLSSRLAQLNQYNRSFQVIPIDVISGLNLNGVVDAYDKVGATLAITGSAAHHEDFTQLTLNLIDTRSLRQVNSEIIRIDHNMVDSSPEEALINRLSAMLELDIPQTVKAGFFAVSTRRQNANDYYIYGQGYLERPEQTENIESAIHYFHQALDVDSVFTLAYAGLGQAYWLMYEQTKDTAYVSPALNACQQATALNGRYAESYLTCGMIYKGTGQYQEAMEKLRRAIELDPANAKAYWQLGETYRVTGDTAHAIKTYQRAIEIRPGYWQGYSHLGTYYLRSGHYEKAKAQYQKIVNLLPNSDRGYYYLAATHLYMEEFELSIRMGEKAAAINPSYRTLNNLAAAYYFSGAYQAASEKYKKVLDYNQNDHRLWGALATSYYFTNRTDSARIYFRQAAALAEGQRKINPHDPLILVCLAGYYTHLGQQDKALGLLNDVEKMAPTGLDIIFDIGDVYEQLGERDKALFWLEKALKNKYRLAKFTNNPGLQSLMADERFQEILKEYQ